MIIRTTILCLIACVSVLSTSTAQVSPEEAIKKILQQVETELTEIDRMLLESSRSDAKADMKAATKKIQELIDGSKSSQGKVVRGIQHLIDELEKMSNDSDSQSGGSGKPREGEEPGDQKQSQRQKSESPDMVDQGRKKGEQEGQQKGKQKGQKAGENQPGKGQKPGEGSDPKQGKRPGQDPKNPGKNTTTGKATKDPTGKATREGSNGAWGQLQKYERFIHSRGGLPETSSKYRRLHEAYQKRSQKTKSK